MNPRRFLLATVSFAFPALLAALTFQEWQAANFTPAQLADTAISGAPADPDSDGQANLHEYVFFGQPLSAETHLLPTLENVNGTLALTYRERDGITDVDIRLQGSNTLQTWITYNSVTEAERVTFTGYNEVTLLDPEPLNGTRRFLRLRLELTPVPALRAATQLAFNTITATTCGLNWTDPNATELGYAVERQNRTTSAWERLVITGSDTGNWLHADADYQTSTTYRVVALGENGLEIPSTPISLPDLDGNGMVDAWEQRFLGNQGSDANADPDGDGRTNAEEFQQGSDPTDFFNGEVPILVTVSGAGQPRASGYLHQPLVIQVFHADGITSWLNAPVQLTVTEGDGRWAASVGGPTFTTLELRSDQLGRVSAYYWLP